MTESMPTKSRLLRTGTLVLIAVVLLIGGGVLAVWLPYHRNQTAMAEVERLSGVTDSEIVRPLWVPDAVDDEYLWVFARVTVVDLSDTQVSDVELEHLRGLTELFFLSLANTPVSDAGLENLCGLTSLDTLWLYNTESGNTGLTDAGLEYLQGLTNLRILWIDNTQVTKTGIEKLQKALPACEIGWTPPSQ